MFLKILISTCFLVNCSHNEKRNGESSSEGIVPNRMRFVKYGLFGFQMDEKHESKVYEAIKLCSFGSSGDETLESATNAESRYIKFSIVFIKKHTMRENETPEAFAERKKEENNRTDETIAQIYDKIKTGLSKDRENLSFESSTVDNSPDLIFITIPFTFNYECTDDIIGEIKRTFNEVRSLFKEETREEFNLMLVANMANDLSFSYLYNSHYESHLSTAKNSLLFIFSDSKSTKSYNILKNKYLSVASDNTAESFQAHMNTSPINLSFLNGDTEEEKGFENVVFSYSQQRFGGGISSV